MGDSEEKKKREKKEDAFCPLFGAIIIKKTVVKEITKMRELFHNIRSEILMAIYFFTFYFSLSLSGVFSSSILCISKEVR